MIASHALLNLPLGAKVDQEEFLRAAMDWHFNPETGSAYWLERAKSLNFDPQKDIKSVEDLALFPNLVDELRDVRVEDLIPRGYGPHPDVIGIYESGGTTGVPKRVVTLRDWSDRCQAWMSAQLDAHGLPRNVNWLVIFPSGPHAVGEHNKWQATQRGGLAFTVDMDPRWVKKLIAAGNIKEAEAYAEHIVEQAAYLLRTQDIGILTISYPSLRVSKE